MKRLVLFLMIIFWSIFINGESNSSPYSSNKTLYAPPDSNRNGLIQIPVSTNHDLNPGEVFITGGIGYGDMTIAGSPIQNIGNYNYYNQYSRTNAPEYGGSLDYSIARTISIGLGVNYQTIRFTSLNPQQQVSSTEQYEMQFSRLNVGIRNLFYLPSRNSDNLHFYMGIRAGLSVWQEIDTWGTSNSGGWGRATPYLNSSDNNVISIQFLWGVRWFATPDLGIHLEVGLGTPYYGQFGLTFRLNYNTPTYTVTKAEYRIMNEGNQMSHKDSVNIGLIHPAPVKK